MLHAERLDAGGGKRTYAAVVSSLPDGTIVEHAGIPHLVRGGTLSPWSFAGYGPPANVAPRTEVAVLTPRSIVLAIQEGFLPQVHESAGQS